MKTKEVVALMNISQDTLRYYEKVGVIPPVNRDENGYRIYNDSDLNWIYLVKNLRNAGVSIESLIEFCRLAQLPKNENIQAQQKQILNKQLEELNERQFMMREIYYNIKLIIMIIILLKSMLAIIMMPMLNVFGRESKPMACYRVNSMVYSELTRKRRFIL